MNTIRTMLVERFEVFKPKVTAKLPLKIGIHRDIRRLAPDLSAREVIQALADYTRGPTYRGALIDRAECNDLHGRRVS